MNRGAVSLKTIIIMVIILLVGVLGVLGMETAKTYLSGAAAGAEPQTVSAQSKDDGKTATVTFTTEKEVQSVVEYGTTPASLLLRSVETDPATSHSLSLTPLKPGTSYYFRIRVGEEVFDNGGIPYSFKTNVGEGTAGGPTGLPSVVPTINVPTAAAGARICNRTTDYNNDGAVNSFDFVKCMREGGTAAGVTPTAAVTRGPCDNVDFDNNGIINSLDRIKCLQRQP